MTINRSEQAIMREIAAMKPDQITDAYALDLHLRHITAAGQLPESINARRRAILRLADDLDPYGENPRAVLDATSTQLAHWQASKAHLKNKTVACYVSHVQEYYRWLVRPLRAIPESPADDLMSVRVPKRKPRPMPDDDYDFAIKAARSDARLTAWLVLMSYCGCRSVDVESLDRDDVLAGDEVPMLRIRGKGDDEDLIPMGHEVLAALDPFLGGRRRGPLFVDGEGRRIKRRFIGKTVNAFLHGLGLPYTAHNLRHRYGSKVYEITRDVRYTQKLLRHRSVASTEIYAAVPTGQDAETMRVLDQDLAQRQPRSHRPRRDLAAPPALDLAAPFPTSREDRRPAASPPSMPAFSG